MPKVSVIMPVYNGERFIAEAIDSVLAQSLTDWELIVVDDGSTDRTPEVLKRYADPRILTIRQQNQGEGGARNAGLDHVCGTYVGFLDADDLYLSNALADFVAGFEAHPKIEVLFSDGYFCDEEKHPLMRFGDHRPGLFTGYILEPLVLWPSVVSVPTMMMVRQSTLELYEARFDPSLKYGVDWDFWTQLARFVQFDHLNSLTALYRVHGANMTSATGLRKRQTDLVAGRLKVMNADWFPGLSPGTRREFFYNLLIGLLREDPEQQEVIVRAAPFQTLPAPIQADLLRLIAGNHLSRRRNTAFALQCLGRAVELAPGDRRSRLLLRLADRNPALAATVLSAWGLVHDAITRIRSVGRRRPKPVPAALLPKSE